VVIVIRAPAGVGYLSKHLLGTLAQ
jgi:hypothetical protein